jgi:single-strand DNA-binding protein
LNKVQLIGRTTKDIEVAYTAQTQKAVARFTLAVNRRSKDDGTDFISCVAWGRTAENMEKYVKKGHLVGISGRIQTGSYDGKNGKVYTTDVIVEEMEFLERKQSDSQQASTPQKEKTVEEGKTAEEGKDEIPSGFEAIEEDIPF